MLKPQTSSCPVECSRDELMARAWSCVSGCEPISRLDRCREHVRAADALRFYCNTTIASMSIEFMFVLLLVQGGWRGPARPADTQKLLPIIIALLSASRRAFMKLSECF
jgi:hypothetical protein